MLGRKSKKRTHHRGNQPLQGGRFQVETPRRRVSFVDVDVPDYLKVKVPTATRFQIIVNDGGELLSLDDVIGSVQVTWNQLNELAYKPNTELPDDWYCIRTIRVSGTQIVMHLTFSNRNEKTVEELSETLGEHLRICFPDQMDPHYQREAHTLH